MENFVHPLRLTEPSFWRRNFQARVKRSRQRKKVTTPLKPAAILICLPLAISATAWFVDDKANGEPVLISVEGEDEGDRNRDSEAEEMGEGEEGGEEEKKDGTSGSNEGGEQDEERESKRRRIDTLRVYLTTYYFFFFWKQFDICFLILLLYLASDR